MENRRKYKRSLIKLRARYLRGSEEEWKDCNVVNIGSGGMGITVHVREKISMGSLLQLQIIVPAKKEPTRVTGVLRWIIEQKDEVNYTAGIEFPKTLDEIELANLAYFMSE